MGQGSDSCSGHEVDYDPYEEGLERGIWPTRTGSDVSVKNMTLRHLHGAKRIAERAAARATFSCDTEKWEAWVELFDAEIDSRPVVAKVPSAPAQPVRGKTCAMVCHCGITYQARTADLTRGWALSCSKSCAAIRRDFGRPPAKRAVVPATASK